VHFESKYLVNLYQRRDICHYSYKEYLFIQTDIQSGSFQKQCECNFLQGLKNSIDGSVSRSVVRLGVCRV
jgi:hypothetical protein